MKKIFLALSLMLFIVSLTAQKTVRESRTQLQESIANVAVDMVKNSDQTLKSCAKQVHTLKHANTALAAIIEQVAHMQELMIDITCELLDDKSGRWAKASRQTLQQVRDTLQNINQQMSNRNRDHAWWCDVCTQITTALPAS